MLHLYLAYMCRQGLSPIQPSTQELSEFVEYLVAARYIAKTIRAYVTVIRRFHLERRLICRAADTFEFKQHLTGVDKTLMHRVVQAPAISPTISTVLTTTQSRK